MRWFHTITNSVDMSLSKLRKMVKERGAWCIAVSGAAKTSQTWLSDWTAATTSTCAAYLIINFTQSWHSRTSENKQTTHEDIWLKDEQRIWLGIFPKNTLRYMERYSALLIIREKQIKTTVNSPITPVGMASIKKNTNNKCEKRGFPCSSVGKESSCSTGDLGLIPGLGRSPGEGNDNPLQYPCLENLMDTGAWWAAVHGVAESGTTERLTFTYLLTSTAGGNANLCTHYGKQYWDFSKIKIELPYGPRTPLPDTIWKRKRTKTLIWKDILVIVYSRTICYSQDISIYILKMNNKYIQYINKMCFFLMIHHWVPATKCPFMNICIDFSFLLLWIKLLWTF